MAAPVGLVVVRDDEVLMRRVLERPARPDAVAVEPDGDRACATVWVGEVAAVRGWVAVTGEDAVVDRVETRQDFRP